MSKKRKTRSQKEKAAVRWNDLQSVSWDSSVPVNRQSKAQDNRQSNSELSINNANKSASSEAGARIKHDLVRTLIIAVVIVAAQLVLYFALLK